MPRSHPPTTTPTTVTTQIKFTISLKDEAWLVLYQVERIWPWAELLAEDSENNWSRADETEGGTSVPAQSSIAALQSALVQETETALSYLEVMGPQNETAGSFSQNPRTRYSSSRLIISFRYYGGGG